MKHTLALSQKMTPFLFYIGFALTNIHCKSESKLSGGVQTGKVPLEKAEVPVEKAPLPKPSPAPVKPEIDGSISKGSFTVWTTPKDPLPYQDYSVFVQISLPSNIKSYTIADLSGRLVGTDLYTQNFGGTIEPVDFRVVPGAATLEIEVPGSYKRVKDTIKVQSKILDEEQEIMIEF